MVERACMKHIEYSKWIQEEELEECDDETICL